MKRAPATGTAGADGLSVPSTRAYAMKPSGGANCTTYGYSFSTLNSGLRDETKVVLVAIPDIISFSTLNSGLRDETRRPGCSSEATTPLSVPSTRAYAMKRADTKSR